MKCMFPECPAEALDDVPLREEIRRDGRRRENPTAHANGLRETAERLEGRYCKMHSLWIVAGCHLVSNRDGDDGEAVVRELLARAMRPSGESRPRS